jgi:hypothetical protein
MKEAPELPALAAVFTPWDAFVGEIRDGLLEGWKTPRPARARLAAAVAHAPRLRAGERSRAGRRWTTRKPPTSWSHSRGPSQSNKALAVLAGKALLAPAGAPTHIGVSPP